MQDIPDEFWSNGCMFWRFQRIFSFFVKRSRTESRKNATSRSNFDKYLDYLASEDRKKILIKSALSLNNFNHPAYADALKTSRRNSCQKWLWDKFIWTRVTVRFGWYCLCDRYETFFKSKEPRNEFWRPFDAKNRKNLEKKKWIIFRN